jgi:hypothetical protein
MVESMYKKVCIVGVLLVFATVSCGGSSKSSDSSESKTAQEQIAKVDDTYPLNDSGQPIVPKDVVQSWPAKFCTIQIGMTRAEARAIMGTPTSFFADSSSNQDEWDGYNVSVTAFYDSDDKVQQLDDSTGTSELPCESSRKNE